MARKPLTAEGTGEGLHVTDSLKAPVVYFDIAPTMGAQNGVVNVTLAVARHLPSGEKIVTDFVVAAHLRCSLASAADLRDALNNALLMAAPTPGDAN